MGIRTGAFLDTSFVIESTEENALAWLDDVLVPWFERSTETRELHVVVRHSRDAEAPRRGILAEPEQLPVFLFDSRIVHLPARRRGRQVVVDDPGEGCRYILDGLQARVVVLKGPGRLTLMRVVREIVLEHERRHGRSVELHAAGLELEGQGIALAGPKGSGKTTLLLHALARHSAGLLANDRVLVDTWTGNPRLTGVPAVIRIRPGTAAAFPTIACAVPDPGDLNDRSHERAGRGQDAIGLASAETEWRLSPARLARLFNVPRRAAAPLHAVIFPELDGGAEPRLSRLRADAALDGLRACVFGGRLDADVPTVFAETVLASCPRARSGDVIRRAKAELIAEIAATVPCFSLAPGPEPESAIDLLRRSVL